MAEQEPNWRGQVPREERVRVLNHILGKIREFSSETPENSLKEKICKLESKSYSSATSHSDYLEKIANAIGHIQKHTKQGQAKQAFANFAQGNLTNQQTQAVLRQQLRQRQQEAFLRRTQLMGPRQLQQYQAQQESLQQQHKQQDPNRQSSTPVQRPQGSASDPKASSRNVQGGKLAQIAAQNPSLPESGKIPTAAAHNATRLHTEEYRQKLQAHRKQAAFNSALAQNLANGAGLPNEYLMALARGQQFPNGSQPQTHVQGHNPQQAQPSNQAQAQLPPGSVTSSVLSSHQQLLQAAQHRNARTSVRRAAQPMLQQRVNQAGTVPRDGGIVNPQTRVNDRYAEAVAAIAKAAATVGLNYTPEQLRTLSPTQLQQVANMISRRRSQLSAAATQGTVPLNHQVRRNEAQISANPHLSAGMGTNMANWMSRSGSAAQGGNSQVGVGQVPVRSQAMNLEMRKQALQNGSSSRTSAGASSGKSDLNNLSANPAAGTVPQMNEMLAQQAIRVDKTGNSTQGKKTAQDIQDPSGVRSSPVARTAASGHLQAGGAVTGGLPSSRAPSGQRAASAGNVSEEEIWAKLNDMQRKYRENMRRLLPVIVTLQNARSPEKSELLMQHLRDVVSILNMSRTSATSKGLTMERLHKAEQFIQRVLYVHTKYVEEKNSQPRSAQPVGNLEDYVRQPAGTAHGTEIPSQPASQMPTTGMIHHVKTDTGLPPGVTPEANALRQQRIEQQKARQLLHMQQNQPTGYAHGGLSNGGHADLSKAASQNTTGKGGAQRPRRNTKAARTNQGLPMSRSISGLMPGQQRLQHPQAPGQEQVVAAAQQQAQAIVEAKAAATRANLESQAAKAQAEVQGLKKVQAKSLANLYPAVDQASRMEQLGALKNMQSHAQSVGPNSHGLATGSVHQQMPQRGGSNMPGTAVPDTGPGASRAKRPELTIQQRMQIVDARVKEACEQARKLEAMREAEIKRDKSERIQTTLAALRNTSGTTSGDGDKSGGTKRQVSLVDVDNVGLKEGVIKPKTVFECSSEAGLRLAKRPKNEAADLRSLREAVEADCRAAKERNPLLLVEIYEEFGLPVVTCLLRIPEIRLPKLVLRVQRGYPRKGGATYGFERPPMGWIGVLEDIRTRFKQGLATTPTASVGVAAFLHVWATAADDVINGSCLSESR